MATVGLNIAIKSLFHPIPDSQSISGPINKDNKRNEYLTKKCNYLLRAKSGEPGDRRNGGMVAMNGWMADRYAKYLAHRMINTFSASNLIFKKFETIINKRRDSMKR